MNITQEQKEFIENIIKENPCYRGNEHLFDEFFNEVIRRAYSLISRQNDFDNIRIYIKRIVSTVILEVVKKSSNMSAINKLGIVDAEQKKSVNICYEFDENGDIALNYDISFEEVSSKHVELSQMQISNIKNIIYRLDEENNCGIYKNIFELRYLKGLNNNQIAQKLDIKEKDLDKKLLFMLGKVNKEIL